MSLFRNRLAFFLAAVFAAAGPAACSGSHSLLPAGPAGVTGVSGVKFKPGFTVAKKSPPDYMQMAYLMTDGSVITQGGSNWNYFYKYTPDANGDYSNGTWTQLATLPTGYAPDADAADVLADGRLFINGGEYNVPGNYDLQLVNLGAVYDPLKNTWTKIGHPTGWDWIGDSPSTVLPNGLVIEGDKLHNWDATWNPKTGKWAKISDSGKSDYNAEEGWTLLPNGTILTEDVKNTPNSEIYDPKTGKWSSAGKIPVTLASGSPFHSCLTYGPKTKDCYLPPGEIGPAMLRPDGTVFATGSGEGGSGYGQGHTAIYNTASGGWSAGPDFPNEDNAGDSFSVLLPSGNVLVFGKSGYLYEFDGSSFKQVGSNQGVPLLLPTGQVAMFGGSVVLYSGSGQPNSSWLPAIQKSPSSVSPGSTYTISGTQFNGLSLAMSFGDEYQNSTNYPLVRITNTKTGHVFYARTHDHSSMGVATGSQVITTQFDVPKKIDAGASKLEVVANGIASKAVSVTVK